MPVETDNLEPQIAASIDKEAQDAILEAAKRRRDQRRAANGQNQSPNEQDGNGDEQSGERDLSSFGGQVSAILNPGGNSIPDIGNIAIDIGEGIIETPGAILSGARDAVQSTLDLGAELDKKTAELTGFLPALQIKNPETGEIDVRFIDLADNPDQAGVELPETGFKQNTQTGKAVKSIAQFATGFAGTSKITGALGLLKKKNVASAAIKGAITDFTAFDGNEGRLADVVADVPGLGDLVPEFLKTSENEDEIIGRLKNTVEGAGVGVAFDLFLSGLRAFKGQQKAATALQEVQEKVDAIADAELRRAAEVTGEVEVLSGNPRGDRVQRLKSDGPGDPDRFAPNLARINSSDDIKQTIAEMVHKHSEEVDAGRRGVVSHRTTVEEAANVNAWKTLQERAPGQTLSAGETTAARELWATSADNIQTSSQAYLQKPSASTRFAFHRAVSVHRAIQAEVMGARAEAGRILNAWKIPVGENLNRLREVEDTLSLYAGSEGVTDEMARRVAMLGKEQIGELDKTVFEGLKKSSDTFGEVWRFALLSNPKTHVVNLLGNGSVLLGDLIETSLAGRLGRIIGDDVTSELVEEAAHKGAALRSAIGDQFKYFAQNRRFNNLDVTAGAKVDGPKVVSAGNYGFADDSAIGSSLNAIGRVLTVPQDLLGGADDFFKGVNYKAEITSQAHRTTMNEVRAGIITRDDIAERMAELVSEPPPAIADAARNAALTRTFTKPPKPGGVVQGVMTFRKAANSLGIPFGHVLLPFVNTPANILKFVADRTPYGYFGMREQLARGGKDAAMAQAQIGLGTSAVFMSADLASNNMITGGGPSDPKARQALERQGWQPYSFKSGDTWVKYNRFDPIGSWLSIGSDFHEILANRGYDDGEDEDIIAVAGKMTGALGSALLSKTYLTGVSEFFSLLSDKDRHGPNYYQDIIAAFVPAGLAEVRRQFDPQIRDTSDTLEAIKNRIPGASQSLAPRHDLWGRKATYQSHIGQAYDALSPFVARKVDPNPVDAELERLRYYPAMPDRSISVPFARAGTSIDISLRNRPDIYQEYVRLAGNDLKIQGIGAMERVEQVIKSPSYQRLADGAEPNPGTKAYAIRKIISAYRRAAAQRIQQQHRTELNGLATRQFERQQEERQRQELDAAAQLLQQ